MNWEVSVFLRILSAVLGFGLLFLTCYFFKLTGLLVLCSLAIFIACVEFAFLTGTRVVENVFFTLIMFTFFLVTSFYSESVLILSVFFLFIVSYFVFLSGCYRKSSRDKAQNVSITGVFNEDSDKLWELKSREIRLQLHRLGWWVTGLLYCGVLPAVVMTGVQKFGYPYFVSLLLIGFSSDTFAYFGGRFFGHRHFVPLISPQKTIEGSLLGLLAGTMAGSFYLSLIDIKSSLILIVALSLTSSLFSQIGDLFESMIKRYHGIKDSGIIMPGHGGLLDRIDSILFAAPVVYVWMLFI